MAHKKSCSGEGYVTDDVVEDLLAKDSDHLEGLLRRHRVNEHVAMDTDEVLRVHDAVLVLAGRIDYLERIVVVLDLHFLAESVFDGGVIALDEVVVDISHGERRLACEEERAILVAVNKRQGHQIGYKDEPTERLPTMASFRSFGGDGIYSWVGELPY